MTLQNLDQEYQTRAALYEALCKEIATQIGELLRGERITLSSPIEYRVKSWASIVEKVQRIQSEPKNLSEIRDIAGIRIIALFRRDIEQIEKIIETNLEVLEKDDTFSRLTENQFGYGSIHYEVRPLPEWLKIPTLKKLDGLRAEIQVRTGSQHIWAAAAHILQYKKETHVPLPLRRSINRAAALLETVDLEFERVLVERELYTQEISKDKEDLPLNTESLRGLLDALLPPKNRDENENYAELLDELIHFDVRTTNQLKAIILRHLEAILEEDKANLKRCADLLSKDEEPLGSTVARTRAGVYFTHVGLSRRALLPEFGEAYTAYRSKGK